MNGYFAPNKYMDISHTIQYTVNSEKGKKGIKG